MGSHHSKGQADWMEQLPEDLRNYPLHQLAIPGSHDSGAFDLSCWKGMAPDFQQPANCLARAALNSCFLAFLVTRKWSQTQDLSFRQQLEVGVRFFDVRVGKRPLNAGPDAGNKVWDSHEDDVGDGKTNRRSHLKSDIEDRLHCVHGLYGSTVRACMNDVKAFLDLHTEEVVLLDFNRFHGLDDSDHVVLADMLDEVFGDLICRYAGQSAETLTLNKLCRGGNRVLAFYYEWGHPGKGRPERCQHFWPFFSIDSQTSWVDTDSAEEWVQKQRRLAPRQPARFYVCQGVLTPDEGGALIKRNLCCTLFCCGLKGTLRTECAAKINPVLLDWVGEPGVESAVMNNKSRRSFGVYSADFVNDVFKDKTGVLTSFVERVIDLNYK